MTDGKMSQSKQRSVGVIGNKCTRYKVPQVECPYKY